MYCMNSHLIHSGVEGAATWTTGVRRDLVADAGMGGEDVVSGDHGRSCVVRTLAAKGGDPTPSEYRKLGAVRTIWSGVDRDGAMSVMSTLNPWFFQRPMSITMRCRKLSRSLGGNGGTVSRPSQLPLALSAAMASISRFWASGGR